VHYPRGTHYSSNIPIPPAWHQWLRHTRSDPPSLAEQQAEVARQERIRVLAAQADARWEAKPKVMEGPTPSSEEGRKILGVREPAFETERHVGPGSKVQAEARAKEKGEKGDTAVTGTRVEDREQREETWKRMRREEEAAGPKEKEKDPWKQARGGPSEGWQPQAWEPAAKGKK
jgi:NADH dehydrogenase [ubiquinone] 1 alpha subcomplex assembly factor 2